MSKNKKIIISILCVILLIFISTFAYTNDYYHALNINKYLENIDIVNVSEEDYGMSFKNGENKKAFIFYPGAKVEYIAYSELMYELASNGIDCYLVKMPGNLAFLGMNKADEIISNIDYDEYYIGGHSLGGAMSANYAYKNQDKIAGLILLGSYSTKDLSNTNIKVLSIYGSNDLILNRENYNKNKSNLGNYKEKIIEGGNHSSFASYGHQKNDGELNIEAKEQINITVNEIKNFINN